MLDVEWRLTRISDGEELDHVVSDRPLASSGGSDRYDNHGLFLSFQAQSPAELAGERARVLVRFADGGFTIEYDRTACHSDEDFSWSTEFDHDDVRVWIGFHARPAEAADAGKPGQA